MAQVYCQWTAMVEEAWTEWRAEIDFAEQFILDHDLGFVDRDSEGASVTAVWLPAALRNVEDATEFSIVTCAPTATRTRDLLLRRHSRNIAG